MAGVKISNLPAATTPLAGTEPLAIVQGGVTVQVPASALGTASTPVVGILKGTGSAIVAAVAGTDYLAPGGAGSFTSLTASTTLGVTGVSTLTGGAVIEGVTIGKGAGAIATNTALGRNALAINTSGSFGTAVGESALVSNTTGTANSAIGNSALNYNNIGAYNLAAGASAMFYNTTGSSNAAVGRAALQNNTIGSNNIALGADSGTALTTGSNNTIIGSVAGTAGLADTVIIAAGTTERLRINSSGNVGIGNASPTKTLDVTGSGGFSTTLGVAGVASMLGNLVVGATGLAVPATPVTATTNFVQKFQSISTTGQSNAMFFKTVANATGPDITMAKSRNGSSDPTAFTAVISGDTLGAFQFGGTDGSAVITNGVVGGYVDGVVSAGVVPTALTFATGPTNVALSRMNISSAGIVSMYVYGAGTATFSAAGVISSVSDETYKIKDGVIADPMPMIMALKPGYYFGKPEANMGPDRQLGFYAQNVRAAIGPEAAPDPEPSKPWGYFDRSVLAVAIEAIKVLTARIEALEAK